MHTRHVFWLDADPGALVMLRIGAERLPGFQRLVTPRPRDLVARADGILPRTG